MASAMNESDDQHVAAQVQELREKAARSFLLCVRPSDNDIIIEFQYPDEQVRFSSMTTNVQQNEPHHEQVMAIIGEILAQNHVQLEHFYLAELNFRDNTYPQFWRGLAANRVLKEVDFYGVEFPNEPGVTRFLASPSLESLNMVICTFPQGTFGSFCQSIQASHIKKLTFNNSSHAPGVSWSLLWTALERGATCLESLDFSFSNHPIPGIENGFESFLTNNTTIQSLYLRGDYRGHDNLSFVVALGHGLAVNTTVKILDILFLPPEGNEAVMNRLIQTVFAEGLERNMTVKSLSVNQMGSPECVNCLVDSLERMMRNRANAAIRDGHHQEESLPVLKQLDLCCNTHPSNDDAGPAATRDQFFDRLSRSDVILVEKVRFTPPPTVSNLSSKVYDFIRSTRVTKVLALGMAPDAPHDNECIGLADAMEANNSISKLQLNGVRFHMATDLLLSPNTYRIRCQCRRNEIQAQTLRKDMNLSLLPLALARLLSLDGRVTNDDDKDGEIEARQLVDRTIAFQVLRDMPALFAVC